MLCVPQTPLHSSAAQGWLPKASLLSLLLLSSLTQGQPHCPKIFHEFQVASLSMHMYFIHSFVHSLILTDQGSDSQTMGSTLKGHLLAHLALAPTKCIFLYLPFVHFGFSCLQFFAQHLTKFHQLPHALLYSSHEYSDFDFCCLVRLTCRLAGPCVLALLLSCPMWGNCTRVASALQHGRIFSAKLRVSQII